MTPEHILALIDWYERKLREANVPKQRIDIDRTFGSLNAAEALAHAHYLCDGIRAFATDPERQRKAGSHLTAIQMCLSIAHWFTLKDLLEHNRTLPPGSLVDKKV